MQPRENYPFEIDDKSDSPELIPLILGDEAYYREALPVFPLEAGIKTIRRNVIYVAGNIGDEAAVPSLIQALNRPEPEIKAAAAWSLGKIGCDDSKKALKERQQKEKDTVVLTEILDALK